MSETPGVWLFSYGTLRYREVQLATFGRELEGQPDALIGFALSMVEITDPEVLATSGDTHHPIIHPTGLATDIVDGVAFRVTEAELAAADAYEVDDYRRIQAPTRSGLDVFVYVKAP